jgi:hypothetical protein
VGFGFPASRTCDECGGRARNPSAQHRPHWKCTEVTLPVEYFHVVFTLP